ncbi:Transglycosylase SLT domain [Quillaja saponaria]|uniref:Transglycosylase SLT domain n=1 Tax=Quillaja saponaria TaxID=32244 RepID=A0AAD7PB11_QUISA|nr:Transglycosylase SLT domain [Quillaja saponaria]
MVSFRYWDDCVDPQDLEEMWEVPEVSAEWINAGETRGQKVHLSRDPDGQPYLTQTEMRAVVQIVIRRHFHSEIDPDMICSIAELESDRQLLAMRRDKKGKETTVGIMQLLPKTAEWLASELGYCSYEVKGNPDLLYRPFVNVYLGAAYLKWLSNFEKIERSEEFIVRAYKGSTKKATRKATLPYWKLYLSVKESLPSRKSVDNGPSLNNASASVGSVANGSLQNNESSSAGSQNTGAVYTYWDSRASPEDMEDMWTHPDVVKEWTKSGEKRGRVRFSHDEKKRSYLSRLEVKAIADIILLKHFSAKAVKSTVLCAIAEVVSMRFINGAGPRPGIMGIDYSTAFWLYTELGYRAYRVDSVDDLTKPFVSMYFGAAYLAYLSEYEGRERSPQFVLQAYISGPQNVNLQETGPLWLKFQDALSNYQEIKKDQGSCTIL